MPSGRFGKINGPTFSSNSPSFSFNVDATSGASANFHNLAAMNGYERQFNSTIPPVIQKIKDVSNDISNSAVNSGSWSAPATPQQLQYIDAPYAEMYGMSAETAYQEALANSAYQRKVADLKKAGLNPVLGISGSGAASFYGESAAPFGYGSSGSGKSSKNLNLNSLPYAVGAAATLIALGSGKGPVTAQAAGSLMQNVTSLITKNSK